jgi:hypothetical protein
MTLLMLLLQYTYISLLNAAIAVGVMPPVTMTAAKWSIDPNIEAQVAATVIDTPVTAITTAAVRCHCEYVIRLMFPGWCFVLK